MNHTFADTSRVLSEWFDFLNVLPIDVLNVLQMV